MREATRLPEADWLLTTPLRTSYWLCFKQSVFRRSITMMLALALSSCDAPDRADESEVEGGEQEVSLLLPRYGQQQDISGLFRFEFEVSSFIPCSELEACKTSSQATPKESCWMVFSERANDDLDRLTGSKHFEQEGVFWIEGKGRFADAPGHFGHLSDYKCQVEMSTVRDFEKLEA